MVALLADIRRTIVVRRAVHEGYLIIRQSIVHRFYLAVNRFPIHPVPNYIRHAFHTDELPATGGVVILSPHHEPKMREMCDGVLRQFSSR